MRKRQNDDDFYKAVEKGRYHNGWRGMYSVALNEAQLARVSETLQADVISRQVYLISALDETIKEARRGVLKVANKVPAAERKALHEISEMLRKAVAD